MRIDDVSPDNDWSEVRVELGDSSTLGSVYPTYGFIYDKPADRTVIAANGQSNEVAEAPARSRSARRRRIATCSKIKEAAAF